ncbi:hypothetical protein HDU93_005201 [Gonapodya sp. JEL0774]|nr:hypothetical protein HDU93_005201 [Gonapodya sp. JEL0774]
MAAAIALLPSSVPSLPPLPSTQPSSASPGPSSVSTSNLELELILNKIRSVVYASRLRVAELFKDFDRHRSGYVARSQFIRCVHICVQKAHSHSAVSDRECALLAKAYDLRGDGTAKYTLFVDAIDHVFGPKNLESRPTASVSQASDILTPTRPQLSPDSELLLSHILGKLSTFVKGHGTDVKSWFQDFDKHNSGYVTKNQFSRGLHFVLGTPTFQIKEGDPNWRKGMCEEYLVDLLSTCYGDPVTKTVNYFKLNVDVNRLNRQKKLAERAAAQVSNRPTLHPLPNGQVSPTSQISGVSGEGLHRDTHFVPVGTEELYTEEYIENLEGTTDEEEDPSAKKYGEPDAADVAEVARMPASSDAPFKADAQGHGTGSTPNPADKGFHWQMMEEKDKQVAEIEERLRKHGVIPLHRTLQQYGAGIGIGCGNFYLGDDKEMAKLVAKYKAGEGGGVVRVDYRKFCKAIDEIFTFSKLESNPLVDVHPPPREYLVRQTNELSPLDAARFGELISRIRHEIRRRRLSLLPFFKDFDKYFGNIGRITRSHFARLLSTLKLEVGDGDLHLLFRKFEDSARGKINYMEFIRMVDDDEGSLGGHPSHLHLSAAWLNHPQGTTLSPREIQEGNSESTPRSRPYASLLSILRSHALERRLRVDEFFRHFDRLRLGIIPRNEFIRGLSTMLGGAQTWAGEELQVMAEHYQDKDKEGRVKWKEFKDDVEVDEEFGVMCRRYGRFTGKNEPVGKDGVRFLHDRPERVGYEAFLKELTNEESGRKEKENRGDRCANQSPPSDNLTENSNVAISSDVPASVLVPLNHSHAYPVHGHSHHAPGVDVNKLVTRLKAQVKTQRIRVIEFMRDFDQLRHGTITKDQFRRSMRMLKLDLNEAELQALLNLYLNETKDRVNYIRFSDDFESVFTTKGMEKNPLLEPAQFDLYYHDTPDDDEGRHVLTEDEEQHVHAIIARFGKKVRERRMDLLPYFLDFDRALHNETLTRSQFRSVLGTLGFPVTDEEFEVLVMKFSVTQLDDVDYMDFVKEVEGAAYLNENKWWTGMWTGFPLQNS